MYLIVREDEKCLYIYTYNVNIFKRWRDYVKFFEKLGMIDMCFKGFVSCGLGYLGKGSGRDVFYCVGEVIGFFMGFF